MLRAAASHPADVVTDESLWVTWKGGECGRLLVGAVDRGAHAHRPGDVTFRAGLEQTGVDLVPVQSRLTRWWRWRRTRRNGRPPTCLPRRCKRWLGCRRRQRRPGWSSRSACRARTKESLRTRPTGITLNEIANSRHRSLKVGSVGPCCGRADASKLNYTVSRVACSRRRWSTPRSRVRVADRAAPYVSLRRSTRPLRLEKRGRAMELSECPE
jgi:hypothetical protein